MSNIILQTLKAKYFELASKENIGVTLELTKEIDDLEKEIRKVSPKVNKKIKPDLTSSEN